MDEFTELHKVWHDLKDKTHFGNIFMCCLFALEYFPWENRDYLMKGHHLGYTHGSRQSTVRTLVYRTRFKSRLHHLPAVCLQANLNLSDLSSFLHQLKGNNNPTKVSGLLWALKCASASQHSVNIHQTAGVVSGITAESLFYFSTFLKFSWAYIVFVIRNKNNKTFFLKGTAIISIFTFVSPPLSLPCLFLLCKAWVLSPQPYSEDSMGCWLFSGLLQGFTGLSSLHPGLQDLSWDQLQLSARGELSFLNYASILVLPFPLPLS